MSTTGAHVAIGHGDSSVALNRKARQLCETANSAVQRSNARAGNGERMRTVDSTAEGGTRTVEFNSAGKRDVASESL